MFKFNDKGFIMESYMHPEDQTCPTFDNPASYERYLESEYQILYFSKQEDTWRVTPEYFISMNDFYKRYSSENCLNPRSIDESERTRDYK